MVRKKSKNKNNILWRVLLIIVTILVGFCLSKLDGTYSLDDINNVLDNTKGAIDDILDKADSVFNDETSNLVISYLDVGQADSILVENNGEFMLIDAGNNEDGKLLTKYFKIKGITSFKYLIGTHPHEDHIGGLDDVINNFEIENIYMPDVITTTKTFTDVLDAIENKGYSLKVPTFYEYFYLGDAKVEIIYSGTDSKNLNNSSIVIRIVFGKNSFLFMGDAEKEAEDKILKSKVNVKADVLKVGHHGSRYSTTDKFLNAVSPSYGIISVGKNNSYNHPEGVILDKLERNNIKVYRTDLEGTIVITSDGKNISINSTKTNLNG